MKAMLLKKRNSGLSNLFKMLLGTSRSLIAATVLLLASVSANALELGEQAPDFELKTFSGETFKLSDYRGKKPVYLVFWATWCPICKAEIPNLKALHTQLGDQVAMLAINVGFQDSLEKAQKYQTEHNIPYALSFDENTVITQNFSVIGTPWQVVIDINGVVRYFSNHTPQDIAEHMDALTLIKG